MLVLLLEVLAARALRETVENRCAFVGFTSLPPFGRLGLKKREALRLTNPKNSRVDFDSQNRMDFLFFVSPGLGRSLFVTCLKTFLEQLV